MSRQKRIADVLLTSQKSDGSFRIAVQTRTGRAIESVHIFDIEREAGGTDDGSGLTQDQAEEAARSKALYPSLKPNVRQAIVRTAASL